MPVTHINESLFMIMGIHIFNESFIVVVFFSAF